MQQQNDEEQYADNLSIPPMAILGSFVLCFIFPFVGIPIFLFLLLGIAFKLLNSKDGKDALLEVASEEKIEKVKKSFNLVYGKFVNWLEKDEIINTDKKN